MIYAVSGIPGLMIPLRAVMSCFRSILGFFGGMNGAWLPCENRFAVLAALLAPVLLMTFIYAADHARKALWAFLLDILLMLCLSFSDIASRQRIDFVSDRNSGAAVACSGRSAAVLISGKSACTEQLFRLMTREGITQIGVINAPQIEFSELSGLEKMLRAIPAEYVMLSDECLTAAKELKSSADAEFLAAEDVMEISGITMACAKSGSEIPADIVLYYGYTRSEPEISGAAGLALYASSRQEIIPDGAFNIHDQTFRIDLK